MFNLSGSEIFFLLLIGLVVLGPEKLPEAMRKFGRVYQEVRKVAGGMQSDLRQTFEDPAKEMRKTAEQAKRIFNGEDISDPESSSSSRNRGEIEPIFVPYVAPMQPAASEELSADAAEATDLESEIAEPESDEPESTDPKPTNEV